MIARCKCLIYRINSQKVPKEKELFAGEFAEDLQLNRSRDLMENPQYKNATHAVWTIETDRGGLSLPVLWEETEWMRAQMLRTGREERPFILADMYGLLKQHAQAAGSQCVERTVMCVMMLFALRLVTASRKKDDNPNAKVIREIVRMLSDKMKANPVRMAEMKRLLQTIDEDGDRNGQDGTAVVQMGIDILADEADWKARLRSIVDVYLEKADKLIDRQMSDAFDAVWEELLQDSRFVQEMRVSTLDQDFNLNLLFNVFGLMRPQYYNTKCRGALSIARLVGYNPDLKNQYHCYSKDYFNENEIEKLRFGFKTDELLNHVRSIIQKHCKHEV